MYKINYKLDGIKKTATWEKKDTPREIISSLRRLFKKYGRQILWVEVERRKEEDLPDF